MARTSPTLADSNAASDDIVRALVDLDTAPDLETAEDSRGLLGRLLDARAARTRDRLATEANAERLRELADLRAEITAHTGDAADLHLRLTAAVDAVSELVAAADARRARFASWRTALSRAVPEGWDCGPDDGGFGWHQHDPGRIAVGRGAFVGQPDVNVLLGLVLHQVAARRTPPGEALTPAEITPRAHAELIADPAAVLRRELGPPREGR
ncbi:hypothetical protein CcI49_17145 [Frankia sp. CcI49]|uniref:hypothetical protein n=1 Tax=Frankia sp. CcI49 TaxID=1745382 RepID=UPI000975BD34|nr:hypothetical protein [Frankia sp. CcI49]ONH59667.1 hypothetical protein CcI49_17145 [Frankia sp. CcI49]